MPLDHERLMTILGDALEAPAADRAVLVERACGDDAAMRSEVMRLLSRAAAADSALGRPGAAFAWAGDALSSKPSTESASSANLLTGTTVGPYELLEVAGRGGMGVVYRGRDKRLNRPVAIKALPPGLGDAPDRLTRFAREARLLSQLSNPFVATVYGLEENDAGRFLVMEWVDGQTLADRLARGAMGLDEAVRVCGQIAAGLAAAHDLGVVHRDVKPTNVMLTSAGQVKLLDFGLARRTTDDIPRPGDASDALQAAATDSVDLSITHPQQIVGTPRYMSPEQLRGEPTDRRVDVFAFGCVLYECLTGKPAFDGNSAVAIAVSVIEREPDFARLAPRTPTALRKLLTRCLAKDPAKRLRDLADARLELDEILSAREWTHPLRQIESRPKRRRWGWAAAVATIAVAGVAGWFARGGSDDAGGGNGRPEGPPPGQSPVVLPTVARFNASFPNNLPQPELARLGVAVSPDGEHLLVSASDGQQRHLWWRRRGEDEFRRLEGTHRAWLPSFSADGQWMTFVLDSGLYKRRVAAGEAHRIARVIGYWGMSSYGVDDVATYVPYWGKGLARVKTGGTPTFITTVDPRAGEFSHIAPAVTPDNQSVVFTVWDGKTGLKIDACKLDGSGRKTIIRRGAGARVVGTPSGPAILFERDSLLLGARFDLAKLEPVGPEVRVAEGVAFDQSLFRPIYSAGDDGTLAYIPGKRFTEESRLSWQRSGTAAEPIGDIRAPFIEPTMTRDRSTISGMLKGEIYRPFLYHLAEQRLEPIDVEGDVSTVAISPDGRWLAYTSNRDGPYGIWKQELSTKRETLLMRGQADVPRHLNWTPDGRHLLFDCSPTAEEMREIFMLDVENHVVTRLTTSSGDTRAPRVSPSGRWLAYSSDETGRHELYVQPFPDGKQPIRLTRDGGDWPVWSPADSVLYFRAHGKLWLMGVDPATGEPTSPGGATPRPMMVFDREFGQSDLDSSDYTVTSEGRVLLVEPSERAPKADHIRVILNWHRLLPPKSSN